eukprot:TRINITY_DN3694_c0_g1_i1.p1 TRINITY_DN3694_c0_g1~~TRINITY_DN3694_c0_g1_i1.p1  ORF type:complete len:187 (-),score=27.14 TRINITY_DN3694_c0_g1_i1:35-595(-)
MAEEDMDLSFESSSEESSQEEREVPLTPKKPSGLPSINIPKKFVRISVENLDQLLEKRDPGLIIIDVRDSDYEGGHIPTSINIPYEDFEFSVGDLIDKYANFPYVVFTCMYGQLRSASCAQTYLKRLNERKLKGDNVFVLSGGFHEYLTKNHNDPDLLEGYVPSFYSQDFVHVNDSNVQTVRPGSV